LNYLYAVVAVLIVFTFAWLVNVGAIRELKRIRRQLLEAGVPVHDGDVSGGVKTLKLLFWEARDHARELLMRARSWEANDSLHCLELVHGPTDPPLTTEQRLRAREAAAQDYVLSEAKLKPLTPEEGKWIASR